jgi:hypothetical protein
VPIVSGAHFTPAWEPDNQITFAWRDEADRTYGDSRLAGNRLFHSVLHEAVDWELSLRGIRYDESEPRLLVHHHLSLSDHVLETEVLDESGQPTEETETYVYEGASLVLHVVDARTHEDVWVAWAEANVEPAFESPDAMRAWVYDMVGVMFEEWPLAGRR